MKLNHFNPQRYVICDSGLVTVSLAKRAANTMRKNAVAIKQEILNFVQINTEGYEVHDRLACWSLYFVLFSLSHYVTVLISCQDF